MRHERGFSLVELIVAMTVTLIVSSAIYGLLTAGGNAFRREPEVADRQQNIRVAMDLVARDVFGAGAAMPTFAQVFTRNDPGGNCATSLNGCGPAGSMGAAAATARGETDEDTDVIEILSADEQCSNLSLCVDPAKVGTADNFVIRERLPQCLGVPGLVMLVNTPAATTAGGANASFAIQPMTGTAGTTVCPTEGSIDGASPPNANFQLTASLAPHSVGTFNALDTVFMYRARLVRYMVAPNPDPLDRAPALWRTETGRFGPDGAAEVDPGTAGFDPAGSPWQIVARGIEDLQIEYQGSGAWANEPPASLATVGTAAPTAAEWNTIVRRVRITLSARANLANLGGESTAGGGAPDRVRGQLSTVVAPRAALGELQMGTQIQ